MVVRPKNVSLLEVIDTFYQRLNGKCYVSFSGGKDSTIVLWLARKIYGMVKRKCPSLIGVG